MGFDELFEMDIEDSSVLAEDHSSGDHWSPAGARIAGNIETTDCEEQKKSLRSIQYCFVSGLPAIIPPGFGFRSNLAHGSLQKKMYLTGRLLLKAVRMVI